MYNFPSENVDKAIFVYETYRAIKLHFTNGSYNFFRYNGKVKNKIVTNDQVDKFVMSNNYGFSQALAKKFNKKMEVVEFLLASLVRNPNIWLEQLLQDDAERVYKEWKKRQESLTYTFISDLNFIFSHGKHFNTYFISENGEYAPIFQYLMNEQICLESAAILNMVLKYTRRFGKVKKDFILEDIINRIDKYEVFVKEYHHLDEESLKKFKKIIKEKAEESLNVLPF